MSWWNNNWKLYSSGYLSIWLILPRNSSTHFPRINHETTNEYFKVFCRIRIMAWANGAHSFVFFFHMYLFQDLHFACWRLLQELVLLANLEYISKSCMRSHGKQVLNACPWAVVPGELVPVGEESQCHVIYLSEQRSLDFMNLQFNI